MKDQPRGKRQSAENDVRQQRHQDKPPFAHGLGAGDEEHSLFEIGVEVHILLKADRVKDLVGKHGEYRQNHPGEKPLKDDKSPPQNENHQKQNQQSHGGQIGVDPQSAAVLRLFEGHRPGLVLTVGQRGGVQIEFPFVVELHSFAASFAVRSSTRVATRFVRASLWETRIMPIFRRSVSFSRNCQI